MQQRTHRRRSEAISLLAIVALPCAALGAHGRFLPNPSTITDPNIISAYGNLGGTMPNRPIMFDRAVTDHAKNLAAGEIRFDFDTYANTNGTQGGVGIAGGFFMDPMIKVKPGFSLQWVQTIIATNTGSSSQALWNLPATGAGQYPDVLPSPDGNGRDDPFYPFQFLPVAAPPGLTRGFQDFPGRNFAGGPQFWFAQLGLVAVSDTPNIEMMGMMFREARVIGTFVYGFEFRDVNGNNAIDGLSEIFADPAPLGWGPATPGYLDTLNNFYDGMGGGNPEKPSGKFKFSNNSNAFMLIPTPAGCALMALGGLVAVRRRRS
ncbi:MAG: hypothetical protein KF768_00995 [Phycisphaeraceae bacterium]|nr:hypothetical protein [Phycisphaeraceae bacterium]